ncbi:hypothetical protein BGZ95_005317, partial [Linnemannia exigua]
GTDGNTVVYSISPAQSNKLQVVANNGAEVLPFSSNIVATLQNSQIITYRVNGATATFNSFDALTGKWAGIGLAPAPSKPAPSTPGGSNGSNGGANGESSGSSTGAIVGGIVGALVVIALIAFVVIRKRRQKKVGAPAESNVPTYYASDATQQGAAAVAPASYPTQTSGPAYTVPQQSYDPAAQYNQQQQQHQPYQQSPYQPQVFQPLPAQQQQQVQQAQVQPGYDPRLSYNPYSGQAPMVQSTAASPTIFQPSQQQSAYSVSPSQSQQPYVYSPTQSAAAYSQPSPIHFPAQVDVAPIPAPFPAPAAAVGSPGQTPVVYTPPTAAGYSQ